MVAAYRSADGLFVAEKPRRWSERQLVENAGALNTTFGVTADGKRVIGLFDPEAGKPETHLRVMLNIDAELRRRSAAAK